MDSAADSVFIVDDLAPSRRCLRIALVTETYPPEVNGVSLTVARMAEGLRERDHAVQVVRLRQDAADTAVLAGSHQVLMPGVHIPRYPHLKMGVPCTRALVALWTRQRPDVVHVATEGPLGWSALRAAARLRLPVVSDFRTNFHAYSRHYGIGWLHKPIVAYLRKFHNRTLRTMVPTEALRRELEVLGFERLSVVARGVDARRYTPEAYSEALRSRWGATAGTLVVLCVGRLAPEKNLGTWLRAVDRLRADGHDVRPVLVGDGPDRPALQAARPDVVFAGIQRGPDLARHYASADLFVFPSLTETFGNVVPEAMASGLPLVAYDYAAAAEWVQDGANGLLASPGDEARFLAHASRAAADAALRQRLGAAASRTALEHDWGRVVDELERVLLAATPGPTEKLRPLTLRPALG